MWLALAAVVAGLALLVWSADRFVDGASATANHAGMPPLLIGMLIIGFGTSAPEMVVSALAAGQGNPGLALGNAFGSNITNIALIIGLVAVISPIKVHSQVVRKELPILLGITLLVGYQLIDGFLSRTDAWILLGAFFLIMGWSIFQGLRGRGDSLSQDFEEEIATHAMPLGKAIFWLLLGLVLLIVSSRILVWGAVYIAESMGVSDLIIGLTVVAIGTSLPELASSLAAIRRNEHDLALGNV
ncbi:MAG: calcium/sodium antiporter, partial [Pseudomonas neustonica]